MKIASCRCLLIAIIDVYRSFLLAGVMLFSAQGDKALYFASYATPLALFPIMAFFLWRDAVVYRPFAFLYSAGKLFSVVAIVVWFCFSSDFKNFIIALIHFGYSSVVKGHPIEIFKIVLPILAIFDIISGVFIFRRFVTESKCE
jgi:hypothetical protein